jgi:membrane protein
MPFLPAKIDDRVRRKITHSGRGRSFFRFLYVLVESFFDEQLSLRAAGLVYTTLLAFVPLLTVSFALLKALGVNTQLEITLYYFLEPLGEKGADISYTIIKFVERMNVAVLGAVGLSTLMYTVISAIGKIESALNSIWHVSGTRHLGQKFSNYLSVVIVGPVLGFTAFSLMVSLKSAYVVKQLLSLPGIGPLAYGAAKAVPYLLTCTAFTLLYIFLPNTRVRIKSALTGGCFAAVSWGIIGWAFTSFVASSSQYSAVYSGLAALFLFVMWLYWNWLVLLAGARVAYYHQYPGYFRSEAGDQMSGRMMERTALRLVALIAGNFYSGRGPLDAASITTTLGVPAHAIQDVISALVRNGVLAATAADPPAYLFMKDPEATSLAEVMNAVRTEGEDVPLHPAHHPAEPEIEAILIKIDEAVSASLSKETLKDLGRASESFRGN